MSPVRYEAMIEARERTAPRFYVPTGRVVVLILKRKAGPSDDCKP